jgi:hypothetical protein
MSKAGSSSSPTTGARSSRTYWVRSNVSPLLGGKSTSSKTPGDKRFVEPYRLSEDQRCAILAPLEDRGVGDEESRELFAAALEYDLASCSRLKEQANEPLPSTQERSPSEEDAAIAALVEAAKSLAQRLQGLDDVASHLLRQELEDSDRFRRNYGEDYLESLGRELRRVAEIGEPLEQGTPAARKRSLSADARRFILRAADAFEACFELTPNAGPNSPFVATLEAIIAITGIGVPTDAAAVTRVLAQD